MTDLFVSYKSEDRARVAPLVAALEADGIGLWWDAHIGGGTEWRDSIERELTAARCVLVVWSERSTGREGSFVRDEATRALRRGAYLPVRIDPVEPPLGFGETQALSLIGWKGDRSNPLYQALLAAAQAVIAGKPRPVPPAYQPKRTVDRRLVIGGGAAAVAIAGAGGWWALHQGSAPGDSVAVLPFENLSGDPAQAYFSDGIAEELRSALTRIAQLKVAAGTSSELMRNVDAPTAATKLGVANIVTGTVRRGAGTLRINANLIDGKSGLTHWSESYDRAIGDALAIETGIAESVAGALKIALGHAEKALLSLGGTSNPVAQDAYLRSRALSREGKNPEALKTLDAAVAADPNYAAALAARAVLQANSAGQTLAGAAFRSKLSEAEAEARHAVALAPGLGLPLAALGTILQNRLDLRGAKDAYEAAYKAAPGDTRVLRLTANFYAFLGDDRALLLFDRAKALDPLRPASPIDESSALLNLGRFDAAIARAREGLARLPGNVLGQTNIAYALLAKGQPGEAMKMAALLPAANYDHFVIESAATASTDRAASDRALATLVANFGDGTHFQQAQVHAWRREPDLAFAEIERAWDAFDPGLLGLKTDPMLAPVRSDPRFSDWLHKIGFS